MYDLERLLADARRAHGPLSKRGGDYAQAWDALNRYLSDAMEKRQTLNVANFGKIGWRLEEHTGGRFKMRPHFQAADIFLRSWGLDAKAHPALGDRVLANIEDFNFSKAAIRFTNNLTKDNVFLGVRAIVHTLGEVCASGQKVSIDFEVGKLTCSDRVLRFDFLAELYAREGLEAPAEAPKEGQYLPSRTFAPASAEAMSSLNLAGKGDGFSAPISAHSAFIGGGWAEASAPPLGVGGGSSSSTWGAGSVNEASMSRSPRSTGRLRAVEADAFERHVAQVRAEADAAIADKDFWETHLQSSRDEEAKDIQVRRAIAKDHQEVLKGQMQEAEAQKVAKRQQLVEMASAHGFPDFKYCPEQAVYDEFKERFKNIKEEQKEQAQVKRQAKCDAKLRDIEQELSSQEAGQKEMAIMRLESVMKQMNEKAALSEAWDKDRRLHELKRAVEDYHKTPASRTNLSSLISAASTASGGSSGSTAVPTSASVSSPAAAPPAATPRQQQRRLAALAAAAGASPPGGGRGSTAGSSAAASFSPEGPRSARYHRHAHFDRPGDGLSALGGAASAAGTPRSPHWGGAVGGGLGGSGLGGGGGWTGGGGLQDDTESVISGFSSPPASRPMTGAVRRLPFGAAASLALHKEKLGSTLRR